MLCEHRPMQKDNWASLLLSLSLLRSTQSMRLEAATRGLTFCILSSEEIKLLPVNVHGVRVGPGEWGGQEGLVHVISVIAGHRGHSGPVVTQTIVGGRVSAPGGLVMQPPVSVMVKWLLLDTGVTSGVSGARLRVSAASDAARSRRRGCGQLVMARGGAWLGVTARHGLFVQNWNRKPLQQWMPKIQENASNICFYLSD